MNEKRSDVGRISYSNSNQVHSCINMNTMNAVVQANVHFIRAHTERKTNKRKWRHIDGFRQCKMIRNGVN